MSGLGAIRGRLKLGTRLRAFLNPPAATPALTPGEAMIGLHDAFLSGWFRHETHELYTGFPVGPDDVVADIGCGLGGHAGFCAQQGARVILVDADPARLAKAVAHVQGTVAGAALESHVSLGDPLPIADGAATRILCSEVLEHVDDPAALLAEMARIGRPGALYLFACPDPAAEALQARIAPVAYFQKPHHVRVITHAALEALVAAAGLEVVSRSATGFFWSLWVAMFWSTGADMTALLSSDFNVPGHPVLDHWVRTWRALLDQPEGPRIKRALDELMPKSQVIVARKT